VVFGGLAALAVALRTIALDTSPTSAYSAPTVSESELTVQPSEEGTMPRVDRANV
jgi:hypothetical protein